MNYRLCKDSIASLQKELMAIKKENLMLKRVIYHYQHEALKTGEEMNEKRLSENVVSLESKQGVSMKERKAIPFWKLTPTERNVLKVLLEEKHQVISRQELARKIWTDGNWSSSMSRLSTIIRQLRKKLEVGDEAIQTSWGVSYCLTPAFFLYYKLEDASITEIKAAQE